MTFDGKYIAQIGWTLIIYIINTDLMLVMKFTQKIYKIQNVRIQNFIINIVSK